MTVRRTTLLAAVALAAASCLGGLAWWLTPPVDLAPWAAGPTRGPWAAWQRQEKVWLKAGVHRQVQHSYRPLDEISEDIQVAVLVSEDLGFFSHSGIDPRAVWEALQQWYGGKRLRGASTITQQLARTLFLSNDRTITRKLKEARLAFWLDRHLGKRRVLELYLNVVEFGPGIYGSEAAAQHYYRCSAAAVGGQQAAGLAAAIPSPALDNPATRTQRWTARTQIIGGRMTRVQWLRDILAAKRPSRLVKSRESH